MAGVEGTLEKADGAAEKALKADAPPDLVAEAKPLDAEKAEKGDAAARLVVAADLVNGVVGRSPAGLTSGLSSLAFEVDVEAEGVTGGAVVERKGEEEKADLALGFCASGAGLIGVETEESGEADEAKAEKGEAVDE